MTTASLHNTDFLKSLGATHVIDRSLPLDTLAQSIQEITSEPIKTAYDAIGAGGTQSAAYKVVAPGGTLVSSHQITIPPEEKQSDKRVIMVLGNVHVPAQRALGVQLYGQLTSLLEFEEIKVCCHVLFSTFNSSDQSPLA